MKLLNLFKANFRKQAIELKRYLPNTIAMVLTIFIIFLAMFAGIHSIGDPTAIDTAVQTTIVNYIFWYLTIMVVNGLGYEITAEATRGTFEQLGMSPSGIWKILSTRLMAEMILHSITMIFLLYLSMFTTGQTLNVDFLSIIPIFILTCISMFGLSFIIAGLTIILKQISAFLQIFQFVLAAMTFISISVAPFLVFFPIVKGLDMIRSIMVHGYTLSYFTLVDFTVLILNALFYFTVGLVIYKLCERYAMAKGLMAHY